MARIDEGACARAFTAAAGRPRRAALVAGHAAPHAEPVTLPDPAATAARPVHQWAEPAVPAARRRSRRGVALTGVAASVAGVLLVLTGATVVSRPRDVGASVALVDAAHDAVPPGIGAAAEPPRRPAPAVRREQRARAVPARVVTPVTLAVPAAGVRTHLEHVALDASGKLDAPRDYGLAGWWAAGPKAGEVHAPAVFVGHVDSRSGPAVFHRLPGVRPGDEVVVTDAAGKGVRFVVYAVERYAKARFPTRRVYGATGSAEVRLITCGGAFDERAGHYRDNIVVFARVPR